MSEQESAWFPPFLPNAGESEAEQEYSDQEPHELDPEEGVIEDQDEDSSIDGIPLNLKTVWETGKLEKTFHPETGKKAWKCNFCNGLWSEWKHQGSGTCCRLWQRHHCL